MTKRTHNRAAAARRSAKDIALRVRLGEDAYGVKKAVSPAAWRLIVKQAHDKGFTVPGYLSDTPDELKPRLHSALKAQATSLADQAYNPQMKELDYEGTVAANLRQKRLDDARSYNQWAAQQQSLSAAAATTAQKNYQTFLQNQAANAQAAANQLTNQATSVASQGISGAPQNSPVIGGLKEQLDAQANAAQNNANAAQAAAPMQEERGAAIRAALQGTYANIVSAAEGDYGKQLTDLNENRLKLTGERAAAVIAGYTKLLDKEIDKANATRDYQGLMAQLNEKSAERQQAHQEFLMGQQTTRRGQTIASNTSKANAKTVANTQKSIAQLNHRDKVADRRQRALNARLDRASKESIAASKIAAADKTNAQKAATSNQKITAVIDTIADILRTQQRGKGGAPGSGYLWDADIQKWRPSRQVLINRGATSAQINAGLAHARGQLLTPQQKAAVGIVG